MAIETQPFEVGMFHGGITDNYLDGEPHRYRYADNYIITRNKKLYTRPGSALQDATLYQIPVGAQRIGSFYDFREVLLEQSARKIYYKDTTYKTLQGPTGNDVFTQGDVTNFVSYAEWNNQLLVTSDAYPKVMKIFKDGAGDLQVRNAGLPELPSSPNLVTGGTGSNYIYAFTYYNEYTVEDKLFIDEGKPTLVQVVDKDTPDVTAVAISGIPSIVNGATDNYNESTIKIKIYRTQNNGDTFYFIDEVANGTTVYNDSSADATIVLNPTLYITDSASLDAEEPPLCKFVHTTNNVTFYAHIKEGAELLENVIQQSFPSDFDSTNALLRVEVDEEITGMSSYEFTPLVFCKASVYRLDGAYNADGVNGLLTVQRINDKVGCISNQSIVRTRKGTFFAGQDGFYWTDGFAVKKVSNEFNTRFKEFASHNPKRIYGTYAPLEDRVYWAVQQDIASSDNDTIYCLDLNFGIREDCCFTTWSGSEAFRPSAIIVTEDETFIRGDSRGYTFEHRDTYYNDPKVDTSVLPSSWVNQTIIWDYVSCAFNFGSPMFRKWVTWINMIADNITNVAVQLVSINDDGKKRGSLKPIVFKNGIIWGDEDVTWGDPDIIWNYDGLIDEKRRFPARGIRCNYKQIQITNAYVTIADSSTDGDVTVNNTLKTATLVDSATVDFSENSVDYYIYFSNDDYTQEYLITGRNPDTITFADPSNLAPNGVYSFNIQGKPKNQVLNLLGYNIHYALLGKTHTPYQGD